MRLLYVCLLASCAAAADLPHVIFLEPAGKVNTASAEIREEMPVYRRVPDASKYAAWLHNESAERALRLYAQAALIVAPGAATPDYYVALVKGGNHGAVGFRLESAGGVKEYPHTAYILLDAEPELFETTMYHETGHVVMDMLAGGRRLDGLEVASIPHSTAALSDRTTAFSEGWAIHLETLAAHLAHGADLRWQYHHEGVGFGDAPYRGNEYYRGASDLTTFSQTLARYYEVRENHFAFASAFRGPDYLRVQLEKARDFSTLRDANQLLQAEGFYASFFFLFTMRGKQLPTEDTVSHREDRMLRAMAAMFADVKTDVSTPWLLELVTHYMRLFPDERTEIVDALNDLSHGVFADAGAAALWRAHYLASLRLDLEHLNRDAINAARKRWRDQVLADPHVLYSRIGPEIVCTVPAVQVRLVAFGEDAPLRFDVNTVQEGILRLIPGITEAEIARWTSEREKTPFASSADYRQRVKLHEAVRAGLKLRAD
ncbi:MAG TPA: hypothetical protein VMI94_03370 [Bryobacteraceae bacterium]|nr:hypothetical protein [Bryobacteraceae bacterium]